MSSPPETVLIIEDDKHFANLLKTLVEAAGCRVVAMTGDGESGIDRFKTHRPTVVFLDIVLPGMSGADVLKRILKIDPAAAVVMLTSIADTEVCESCLVAGAKDYIAKGKNAAILAEELARAIAHCCQGQPAPS